MFKRADGSSERGSGNGEGTADGQGGEGRRHRRRVRRDGGRPGTAPTTSCRRWTAAGFREPRGRLKKSGPPSGDEVGRRTEKFFTAWEKGTRPRRRRTRTTPRSPGRCSPPTARRRITDVEITPGTATGTAVPFTLCRRRCRTRARPSR
ncbi:hypothetical protein LV779_16600 [Streptomyces thinghirensis]|nr:hypothetical protein [Streptomyces thinghirensis]